MEAVSGRWRSGKREEGAAVEGWSGGRQEEEAAVKGRISERQEAEDIRIRIAERIGDILLENAIWSEDGTEVGWITMTAAGSREKSYLIRPMDCSLYGGLAGIALFMAELSGKTEKEDYKRLQKILVDMLLRHTDKLFRGGKGKAAYGGIYGRGFAGICVYDALRNLWEQHFPGVFTEAVPGNCRRAGEGWGV